MRTFAFLFLFLAYLDNAIGQDFSSGTEKVALVELYTSEGCSSCPPADRWLSSLKSDARLWQDFVPLAFHVDYWDYIGWEDPYAKRANSERQRRYASEYSERVVYTPGIRRAGEEWRGWRRANGEDIKVAQAAGELQFSIDQQGAFSATYSGDASTLNIAVLGMELSNEVTRGENRGKTLEHDFVVLSHTRYVPEQASKWKGQLEAPAISAPKYAIAVWVSQGQSPTPLQATGGLLNGLFALQE